MWPIEACCTTGGMSTHTKARVRFGAVIVLLMVGTAALSPAVLAGVSAATAAASGSDKPPKQTAIHIVAFEPWDEGGTIEIDNGEPGFGPGDQFLEHHRLLDPATGEEIGRVTQEITVIETAGNGDFLFMVHSELTFDGGTVQDAGSLWYSEVEGGTATVAATGGTGIYAHTTGTVRGATGEYAGRSGLFLTLDVTRNR